MYFVSVHIYSFHLTYLCLVLSVFQGSSFSFLPSSNLTKHMRGTISRSSSDEEFCRAPSPASSDSRYLFYRGLSSTPKKMSWFDYLYGRESAESGKSLRERILLLIIEAILRIIEQTPWVLATANLIVLVKGASRNLAKFSL